MKRIAATLSAALLAGAFAANAEQWTLEQCVDYAVAHNLTVKTADVDVASGELSITEAKDAFLPTASASAAQQFSFGRSLNSLNIYDNMNTSSFSWGANVNLPLFQGLRSYRRLQTAKASLRTLLERSEATRDDVTLNVMAAYLQALAQEEMLSVARLQATLSSTELTRRRDLLAAGKIAEADVLEAEAQLANDELSIVDADNARVMALIDLQQLLELPYDPAFTVAPMAEERGPIPAAAEVWQSACRNNHSLKAAQLSVNEAEAAVSEAKTGYIPTLGFNMGIGSSYYNLKGVPNESFGSQMRHNYSTGLSFSLNVPIFDGFATRNAVRRARVNRVQAELGMAQQSDNLFKAIQTASQQAIGADKRLSAAATAVTATKSAFDAMQVKYENGRANATELEQAKTAYIKALSQQVQARYELALRRRILAFYAKES